MKKYLFFIAAGALTLYSCTAFEPESIDSQLASQSTISIPMSSEDVSIEPATKAYLNETESSWSYVWEDGDQLGFFLYRRGLQDNQGLAEVDKRPYSTNVVYNAADFKAGDVIYTYLYQPEAEAELGDYGLSNTDANALYVQIPAVQYTSYDPETYEYHEDMSFNVSGISTTGFRAYTIKGTDQAVGTVPQSGTLSFKIVGYNSGLVYKTGENTSNFYIDAYGNASVEVSFDAITEVNNKSGKTTTDVKVYVDGHEDKAAVIPVIASVSVKSNGIVGSLIEAITGQGNKSLTYSYTYGAPSGASVVLDFYDEEDVKPLPVRNSMPCVSKSTTITSTHLLHPEDIQASMTMYMLGSVAEFRCYSLDEAIAAGETLYGVIFSSKSGNCAGMGTYDLKGGSLGISSMSEPEIIALDEAGITLRTGKENYASLYMVLAPGTYAATVSFITDQNVYIFEMAEKTFSRAVKKAINCNFASSSCTVIPLDQYYSSGEPEDTGESEEDM